MKVSFSKHKNLTIFFILLLSYCFYDAINSGNSGYSDENRDIVYLLLIIMIGWEFIYLFITRKIPHTETSLIKKMVYIPIWILLCGIFNEGSWVMFVHIFLSIWWITSYQYFQRYTIRNCESIEVSKIFFVIIFFFYVCISFYAQTNIAETRGQEHIVLNYSYNIISFVPIFLLLFNNKKVRIFLIATVIIMSFFSYKRGPLLILPVMYFVYVMTDSRQKGSSVTGKIILLVIFCVLAFIIADNISGGYLSNRFSKSELSNGSNRADMWIFAWNDIKQRDFFALFIGKGSGSSIKLLSSGCHNEWLEFLFSFGIIGVFLYSFFGITLTKRYLYLRKHLSEYAGIYGTQVVFFWMVGLFSGFYFVHTSFYFFSSLALIESLVYNEQQKTHCKNEL